MVAVMILLYSNDMDGCLEVCTFIGIIIHPLRSLLITAYLPFCSISIK